MAKVVTCPDCKGEFKNIGREIGSIVYNLDVYECTNCGLKKLTCGNTKCDGYMEAELLPSGYRYECTKCGWSGVSGKKPPS